MTWAQGIQAFTTTVIGSIVAWIAYQQHWTNKLRARLDLFERRMKVVGEIRKILSDIFRDAAIKKMELVKFRTGIFEADFLFGPEVMKFIDEIYSHGLALSTADELYHAKLDRPDDYDAKKNADEMEEHLTWLVNQLGQLKGIFKKYMDVSNL